MNADCKGALAQLDNSYKSFTHKGKSMSKEEVRAVLEYAVKMGYDDTGQIKDEEIESILKNNKTI